MTARPLVDTTNQANLPRAPKPFQHSEIDPGNSAETVCDVASPPNYATEYIGEIVDHMLIRERSLTRNSNYLTHQPDISERMRIILVDWLVDVHIKFKLHPETFFLAVDVVDRYLMVRTGSRATLQLVGVTAILLAAKHEEIWPPEVKECIYISANTYTREDIVNMEREITNALNFKFCVPTVYPFACRLLDAIDASQDLRNLTQLFLDCSALQYGSLQFRPSRLGYAAVLLASVTVENSARSVNGIPPISDISTLTEREINAVWGEIQESSARCTLFERTCDNIFDDSVVAAAKTILPMAQQMLDPNTRYQALRRKYNSERLGQVGVRFSIPPSI